MMNLTSLKNRRAHAQSLTNMIRSEYPSISPDDAEALGEFMAMERVRGQQDALEHLRHMVPHQMAGV